MRQVPASMHIPLRYLAAIWTIRYPDAHQNAHRLALQLSSSSWLLLAAMHAEAPTQKATHRGAELAIEIRI